MRIQYLTIGMLYCMLSWSAYAATLEDAIKMVEKNHPELSMSALDTESAKAQLTSQSAYAYNPELSLELQDRKLNAGGHATDYYIGLSQGIEMGGKRGYREQLAQASVDSSVQNTALLKQRLKVEVARAFVSLYVAKQTLDVRKQQAASLQRLSLGVQQQLDVGDANILDANLAQSAYTTAVSAQTEAQQIYTLSQSAYWAALGRFDEALTQISLPQLNLTWQVPEKPLAIALRSRPEIAVLKAETQQSHAQAELADAERFSDPTLSLMGGREAGENLVKIGLSFAIPLTSARKGAYQSSLAQATQSEQRLLWFKQRLQLDVDAAVINHKQAMLALQRTRAMQTSLDAGQSVKLAEKAFQAGELSLEDLVLHINQALEARLTSLNMMKQGWFARIRLAEVLGQPKYMIQGIQK